MATGASMKLGLAIKNFVGPSEQPDIDALYAYAQRAEALGFESLWAELRVPHAPLDGRPGLAAGRRVQSARGPDAAAAGPAPAPADPDRRLRGRGPQARRDSRRRLADLLLHAGKLPPRVGQDRRLRARGGPRSGGAHRHEPAGDLRRPLARGDRGADAPLAPDRMGRRGLSESTIEHAIRGSVDECVEQL